MTKNDYTTLVSLRVENETLKVIDGFCVDRRYYNRSVLINMALRQLFVNCNEQQIWNFLQTKLDPMSCVTKN